MEQRPPSAILKARLNKIRPGLSLGESVLIKSAQVQAKIEEQEVRASKLKHKGSVMDDVDINLGDSESEEFEEEEDEPYRCASMFEEQYRVGEKIGEGAHGLVRRCYHKDTDQLYAVKTMRLEQEHVFFLKENFTTVKNLQHHNLIRYHALFLEKNSQTCHLVMDYEKLPDLLSVVAPPEPQLRQMTFQVLEALEYMHSFRLCHRDIKPENILYDPELSTVKLIDFGISKKVVKRGIKREMLTITGTLQYRAPEMFEGGGYDEMVDMWALGVTVYRLMCGTTPFESEYQMDTIQNILRGEFEFTPHAQQQYGAAARNFVRRLITRRKYRLKAKDAKRDFWFLELGKKGSSNAGGNARLSMLNMSHNWTMDSSEEALVAALIRTTTNTGAVASREEEELPSREDMEKLLTQKKSDWQQPRGSEIYEIEEEAHTPSHISSKSSSPRKKRDREEEREELKKGFEVHVEDL